MSRAKYYKRRKEYRRAARLNDALAEKSQGRECKACKFWEKTPYVRYKNQLLGDCKLKLNKDHEFDTKMGGDSCPSWETGPSNE